MGHCGKLGARLTDAAELLDLTKLSARRWADSPTMPPPRGLRSGAESPHFGSAADRTSAPAQTPTFGIAGVGMMPRGQPRRLGGAAPSGCVGGAAPSAQNRKTKAFAFLRLPRP